MKYFAPITQIPSCIPQ